MDRFVESVNGKTGVITIKSADNSMVVNNTGAFITLQSVGEGTKGEKGDKGDKGDRGDKGDKGDVGDLDSLNDITIHSRKDITIKADTNLYLDIKNVSNNGANDRTLIFVYQTDDALIFNRKKDNKYIQLPWS